MAQCEGVVTNPKNQRFGERCRLSAKHGSEYCNVHGGNLTTGIGHPETLEKRCIARTRTGERCGKPPIAGAVVCLSHGGKTRHVRAKAQERLARMADPALTVLYDRLTNDHTPEDERTRIALAILDRVGMSPGKTLEVDVQVRRYEQVMHRIIREAPEGVEFPGYTPGDEDIEDAEVVEDEEPTGRDLLPQIIPPRVLGESATIRIGSPLDREKRTHAEDPDD